MFAIVIGKVRDRSVHFARKFLGSGRLGQAAKVRWEHRAPMHTDVPRTALVSEENHIILPRVDVPKQPKEDLERLKHFASWHGPNFINALSNKSVELGNECVSPHGLLRAVPPADWEAFIIFAAHTSHVEVSYLIAQRRHICVDLGQDGYLDKFAYQRVEFGAWCHRDRTFSDDEKLATAQALKGASDPRQVNLSIFQSAISIGVSCLGMQQPVQVTFVSYAVSRIEQLSLHCRRQSLPPGLAARAPDGAAAAVAVEIQRVAKTHGREMPSLR
jgi:hypothetical protein